MKTIALMMAAAIVSTACSGDASCQPDLMSGLSTLHLYVSNQSFEIDPVDIEVYIDDDPVVCDVFAVEGQHNWILYDLDLDPGTHTLRAVGHDGTVNLEETFEIDDERWAVLDFWFYPGDSEQFTFSIHDDPVFFA